MGCALVCYTDILYTHIFKDDRYNFVLDQSLINHSAYTATSQE